jgi:SAM-dependent methyltransferase
MEKHQLPSELLRYLCCPDDRTPLANGSGLLCPKCEREFEVRERVIDLRPLAPAAFPPGSMDHTYTAGYLQDFAGSLAAPSSRPAWGSSLSGKLLRVKQENVAWLRPLVCEGAGREILCDFSGGAGHYTLAYAGCFRHVFHCDLSTASLRATADMAAAQGIENITFLRIDYLRPPFHGRLDRILCLDTLIRSPYHEIRLLEAIAGSLAPAGRAFVDFHNYWHNPLRRLGVLPDNFIGNRSYSRSQTAGLLRAAGLRAYRYIPFRQEFPEAGGLARLIPPTRHIYEIHATG